MAKFTKEQVKRWNEKLTNGFHIDINRLAVWGEKEPVLIIPLSGGRQLRAELGYKEITENFRTVGQQPTLRLSLWTTAGSGFYSTHGLGYRQAVGTPQTKKSFAALAKLTEIFTPEEIRNLAEAHAAELTKETL